MGPDESEGTSFRARYSRGIRTSIRNNGPAYGYSVTITATFGVMSVPLGTPRVGEVFLFLGGAVAAVLLVESVVSHGFRQRLRGAPAEVVALGSAIGVASAAGAVGIAALTAELVHSGVAWALGSLLATIVFLLIAGVELALAERASPGEARGSPPANR